MASLLEEGDQFHMYQFGSFTYRESWFRQKAVVSDYKKANSIQNTHANIIQPLSVHTT